MAIKIRLAIKDMDLFKYAFQPNNKAILQQNNMDAYQVCLRERLH